MCSITNKKVSRDFSEYLIRRVVSNKKNTNNVFLSVLHFTIIVNGLEVPILFLCDGGLSSVWGGKNKDLKRQFDE